MTEISPSAREAAERNFAAWFEANYPGPRTIISDPQWHAPKIFAAVERALFAHQAREGKGEAGAWPEFDEKAANAEIDRMSNDDSYRGRRWDLLSVMRWQHESLRKIMKAPPAPKDERVEKLIAAVKKYLNQAPVDGWHFTDCDSADDNYDEGLPCSCGVGVSEAELREALRAFKGGENG